MHFSSLQNAGLKVYLNRVFQPPAAFAYLAPDGLPTQAYTLEIPTNSDASIHVEFDPVDPAKTAKGKVQLFASNVSPYSDQCLTTKFCLKLFGDASDAGYELRNVNKMQLHCLAGDSASMSAAVRAKCKKWLECLKSADRALLESFLRAALGEGGSPPTTTMPTTTTNTRRRITTTRRRRRRRRQSRRRRGSSSLIKDGSDEVECLDPATADPESWDCDCVETMKAACSASTTDMDCFKAHMCNHGGVCRAWKKQHCSASLVESEADKRVQVTSSGEIVTRSEGALDSTVQGKCTSETQ